jgi:hypothetical protein
MMYFENQITVRHKRKEHCRQSSNMVFILAVYEPKC